MAYWRWPEVLPGFVRVQLVELPGRDGRRPDPQGIVVGDVAAQIAAHADAPYALYGHSMGARLAFEVIRELRRTGVPLPVRLYVGAAHPPHLPEPITRLAHLSEDGFLEQLILRAGTPPVVRDDPDVREAVLPTLRTDLAWLKRYRYRPADPLPVPVVAFAGVDDREVPDDLMLGWARHTSASFRLHTLVGDHLFIRTDPQTVTAMIADDLASALTGADAGSAAATRPASDEVHLWRLALDNLPQDATGELCDDDARAAGIVDDTDRRRHVACRVALRRLLRRYGTDPLRPDPAGPSWSVSRSAGTAVVAVSHADLGVDVEVLRPMADLDDFCERALEPAERAEVLAEPEEHQLRAALRCWTAKEAVRKAAGDAPGGSPPGDTGWQVTHLDLDGAVVAVATRAGGWRLRFETLGADLR